MTLRETVLLLGLLCLVATAACLVLALTVASTAGALLLGVAALAALGASVYAFVVWRVTS